MTTDVLIYGANGYTGTHVARLAIRKGLKPLLAVEVSEFVDL